MAISGTTQVTATIAPSSITDVYATHDAFYGKGGLRSVADITERNAIPTERRTAGMVVFCEDSSSYFSLKDISWNFDDDDWTPFASGGGVNKVIAEGETLDIQPNTQYLLYGDFTINGTVNNAGELVIVNGTIIVGENGIFDNTNGEVSEVDFVTSSVPLGTFKILTTTPSNPSSGYRKLYPKSDGFYQLTSSGVESKIGLASLANILAYGNATDGFDIFVGAGSQIVSDTALSFRAPVFDWTIDESYSTSWIYGNVANVGIGYGSNTVTISASGINLINSVLVSGAIEYDVDRSLFYNDRSLVDKAYVNSLMGSPGKVLYVATIGATYNDLMSAKNNATSGDLIVVFPGTYNVGTLTASNNLLKDGVNWYFHKGVTITGNGYYFNDNGVAITSGIYGYASLSMSTAIAGLKTSAAGTKIHFECYETLNGGGSTYSFYIGGGTIDIVAYKVGQNGTGLYMTGSPTVTANIREFSTATTLSTAANILVDSFSGTAFIDTKLMHNTQYYVKGNIRLGTGNTGTVNIKAAKMTGEAEGLIVVESGYLNWEGNMQAAYAGVVTKGNGNAEVRIKGYVECLYGWAILSGGGSTIKLYVDGYIKGDSAAVGIGVGGITGTVTSGCHLDLNGTVYSNGVSIYKEGTATVLMLNSVKIIGTGECITSSGAQNVAVLHSVKSNVDKNANITFVVNPSAFAFDSYIS